jgi:hypothetical protein
MRRALAVGILAAATFALSTAVATAVAGWWAIPVLAAVWTRVLPPRAATGTICALGAASGWALLLAWDAAHGPVGTVARRVGGVFLLPAWGFVGLTLLFAAILAAAAAATARRGPVR